ncbi:MAG: DUF296 domain-containing protein [Schwartzia succinivorans]|uniref:PPC domain-containing DNA-binding protein n=1 Tax=Schwartzia succinivorans TaxID=55507 RepID=UPI002352C509|nr:DUF296 domain-containing protein [Schwartzia succinivorans]MBE6098207.1 DUF296 domain-containing protein [Schwartzia succinivorans]
MDYKKMGAHVYIRVDKGDEILSSIRRVCSEMDVKSATFLGIGACDKVVVATFIPSKQNFLHHERNGMLEMISLQGNIVTNDKGELIEHAHGMFAYLKQDSGEMAYLGGHLLSAQVSYTAEIVLDTVEHGYIGHQFDPITKINVWKLEGE